MAKRLLLVGWDAADWKLLSPLMDAGQMPALNQVVDAGVIGDLLATQPLDTAAQWTSIATGKRPWRHGVIHSRDYLPAQNQFVAVGHSGRYASTLWEILAKQGLRTIAVGWPATHGSEAPNARIVSDRYSEPTAGPGIRPWPPANPGTYWPLDLGYALDSLRVNPEDIGVDIISRFVPKWKSVDQKSDRRIGRLRVLLTADFSHLAAITRLLHSGEWDFAAVRLPALGHISRLFAPFKSPRRPWISELEFDLYQEVLNAECRLLDQNLALLRKLTGIETALMLVSGHGTRSADVAPTGFPQDSPHAWKSPLGMLAMTGPGIVQDGLAYGASVLDVAPTVLTWFGLPLSEDMEGRVLVEAFVTPPLITHTRGLQTGNGMPDEALAPPESEPPAARAWRLERLWNFAQSCLDCGQLGEALPALERLFHEFPERAEFAHALFQCQMNLKQLDSASETLEVLLEIQSAGVFTLLPRAELALAKRDITRARAFVNEVVKLNPTHPAAQRRLGMLLLRLREWQTLSKLAEQALKLNETDPILWLGLAEASLRLAKAEEAEMAARRAIQLKYFLPDAHFILSRALLAQNKWDAAREALSALMKLQPNNRAAQNYHRRVMQRAED